MATLIIDRSTSDSVVTLYDNDWKFHDLNPVIWPSDSEDAPRPEEILDTDVIKRLSAIIVGIGPGSFAGIRSSLAFAQGIEAGTSGRVKVLGITSAASFAPLEDYKAVIGDSRRGKFWVALFDGYAMPRGKVFQVEKDELADCIPPGTKVVSPDFDRIGEVLTEVYGARHVAPAPKISAKNLFSVALENPSLVMEHPLPIYLNPAVR